MPAPMHPCSNNCGTMVATRRPSKSGQHWCKASKCQVAKQRFYRDAQLDDSMKTQGDICVALIKDLLSQERSVCVCGLQDALPGWYHRDPRNPSVPCMGSGRRGLGLPKGALDAIHPDLLPTP